MLDNSISRTEELARIGRENELAEIEYEDANVRIHLTFEAPQVASSGGFDPTLLAGMMGMQHTAAPSPQPLPPSSPSTGHGKSTTINSPLAGVFYRAPSPDAEPFVKVGDRLAVGQTLCIVEAMKLMNEIAAEQTCNVVEFLVENGEPVEEGQPLILID